MVSVTIPTLNSARTLDVAIGSVKDQTLGEELEVIVIDGGSKDDTVEIATRGGAKVISDSGRLLGARRHGLHEAKGRIIAMVDSDQVLRPGCIRAACGLLENGYDMVALGERVYQPRSLIERLSDLDKQLLSRDLRSQLNPLTGVILPRVFRREILESAFSVIPEFLDEIVIAHDHAIIYFESFKVSTKVGYIANAVWHVEPERIISLWRRNYRYGWSTRQLLNTRYYANLVSRKTRPRMIEGHSELKLRLASLGFLSLKAVAYITGYAVGGRLGSPV